MSTFPPKQNQPSQRTSSTTARPGTPNSSINQQEHPILNLQRAFGNQAVLRRIRSGCQGPEAGPAVGRNVLSGQVFSRLGIFSKPAKTIQPKLTVNTPGDAFEQEADRVADQVMRMPSPSAPLSPAMAGGVAGVQRACACGGTCSDCKNAQHDDEHAHVQMKAEGPGSSGGMDAPPIVHNVLRSPGQPLDAATRAFMEPRFGHDFSGVRVHTDARAAESASAVGARAYTAGRDVVFGAGEFAPGSGAGQKLLGHELAHVVQQDVLDRGNSRLGASRLQRQPKPAAPPAMAGGNVLYIGMSTNSPLEASSLQTAYHGKPVSVTAITLSDTESKTRTSATGAATFDLTSDAGIDIFVSALNLTKTQAKSVGDILRNAPTVSRDDWAHVIAVYAQTESDGKDRMSRVILSGHSDGVSVFSKEKKGEIAFGILAELSGIFPNAASQTRHLMVPACFAGEEDTLLQFYQKAFPNLKTFAGWTWFSPTSSEGAKVITGWAHITDVDPATLPAPKTGESTWESGTYHGGNPRQTPAQVIDSLHFQQQFLFDDYFTGNKVGEKYSAVHTETDNLPTYYARALAAANRQDITGADHDYAQTQAHRAFRLRFWKEQTAGFWAKYGATLRKGYGSAKTPDYGHLSRQAALEQITAFPSVANGTEADKAEAQRLLDGLRDLDDPTIMDRDWI
jgi:hypothetical protein